MNIVYTAASSEYYDSLLTLISSIHEYCNETVDRVVVYDIDLSSEQKETSTVDGFEEIKICFHKQLSSPIDPSLFKLNSR